MWTTLKMEQSKIKKMDYIENGIEQNNNVDHIENGTEQNEKVDQIKNGKWNRAI